MMKVGWGACGVCGEGLTHTDTYQPVALPSCGHTYCRSCLHRLQQAQGPYFPCPECRAPHRGEDIANLPTNYLVLRLLAEGKEVKESPMKTAVEKTDRIGGSKDGLSHPLLEHEEKMELKTVDKRENDASLGEAELNNPNFNIPKHEDTSDEDNTSRRVNWERLRMKCELSWRQKVCLVAAAVVVVFTVLGAIIAIAIAPAILDQLGFGEKGVRGNTYASRLMSITSRRNNGTIPADSMVSWLQQAGRNGLGDEHRSYFGLGGAGAGLAIVAVLGLLLGLGMLVLRGCWGRRGRGLLRE